MTAVVSGRTREPFALAPAPPDPLPNLCPLGYEMARICELMMAKVREAPDELDINVALLQLQNRYFLCYEMAPKAHKDHIGTRNGHSCLHQVWRHYYGQLRELLLVVNPPPLRPPVPPPMRPQIEGIFLGEEVNGG